MQISIASILTVTALVGAVSALPSAGHKKCDHSKKHHNTKAPKGKVFDHIIQVWFENQDFDVVAAVPAFDALLKEGILLDNFNAITHPSQPNYVAAAAGSNLGVVSDDFYSIPSNVTTIYDLLEKKGLTWTVYQEDLPIFGPGIYRSGEYVRKHDPAVMFDSIGLTDRVNNIVDGKQLDTDIAAGNFSNWMFYTPNMLNDAHDTNATFAGNWLTKFYANTLSKPEFFEKTLILITFDETETYPARNRVWSLLTGAIPKHLKGTTDSTFYSHFSTLSTVEHNWDLGNLGRQDSNKTVANVFEFAAKSLHYNNINIPESEIPWMNNTIDGMMTGLSYNETHPN